MVVIALTLISLAVIADEPIDGAMVNLIKLIGLEMVADARNVLIFRLSL